MKRLMAVITCSMPSTALPVAAQTPPIAPPNTGTVLLMTGTAEIEVANDEAVASFFYEAQDADLAKAQGLVNQRVGDGTAALKRADPKAQVETSGYSSYPVYAGGSRASDRRLAGAAGRDAADREPGRASAHCLVGAVVPRPRRHRLPSVEGRARKGRRAADPDGDREPQRAPRRRRDRPSAVRLRGSGIEEVNFGVREGGPQPMMMRQAPMMASDASAPPPSFESGRSTERLTVSGKGAPAFPERPRASAFRYHMSLILSGTSALELSASDPRPRRLAVHRRRARRCTSSSGPWPASPGQCRSGSSPSSSSSSSAIRRARCRTQPNAVLSPADGRIVKVEKVRDPMTERDTLLISVFMNVFNVHSNRAPVDGTVERIQYSAGKFVNADLDKASSENERNAMVLQLADGERIAVVQVAGLIARRILCYAKAGQRARARRALWLHPLRLARRRVPAADGAPEGCCR